MSSYPSLIEIQPGLTKEILVEGSGTSPITNQEVVVHYTGKLKDGTVFDSSVKRKSPFKFILGVGQVIKGWDLVVATMKKGEKCIAHISSDLAYGAQGSPPTIPENAPLDFEIELISFEDKRKNAPDMDDEEKLNSAQEFKNKGNDYFKNKEFGQSIYSYQEALKYLEGYNVSNSDTLLASIYCNLCICNNNVKSWSETIKYASKVIEKNSQNPKARYLRGLAYLSQGNSQDAISDFNIALKSNPNDEKLIQELKNAKVKYEEQKAKEKKAYKNLFGKDPLYKEVPKSEKEVKDNKSLEDKNVVNFSLIPANVNPNNSKVFMNIKMGANAPFKIVFELFNDIVPKTADNFKCLCTGEKSTDSNKLHYKGVIFHRIIKGFMMQGGDFEKSNGTGGSSIYGKSFDDENFHYGHSQKGLLSMANSGKNTNGSQFFILFKEANWLDGKHVVFGKVIEGLEHISTIENTVETIDDKPKEDVIIEDCGIHS